MCDASFANSSGHIQQAILELDSQYHLGATPVASSIRVTVNGASVLADATNGWTYVAASNNVIFHGAAVPPPNSII